MFHLIHKRTQKHVCTMGLGSESMLPKINGRSSLTREIKKLLLISPHHPNSKNAFDSYPVLVAERQRQLIEGGAWVIHPYSLFNFIWCSLMVFINLSIVILAPFRFAYILPMYPVHHVQVDRALTILKLFCCADMFFKFNTGYQAADELDIVMVRKRIICHYLYTWFVADFLSTFPICCMIVYLQPSLRMQLMMRMLACIRLLRFYTVMLDLNTHYLYTWFVADFLGTFPICCMIVYLQPSLRMQLMMRMLTCIRLLRFYTVMEDFKTFIKIFNLNYLARRYLRHALLFIFLMHLCNCLLYVVAITSFYWTGVAHKGYSNFLGADFDKTDIITRYKKAAFITSGAFFGTGFSLFRSTSAEEIIVNATVVLIGAVFMMYTSVFMLKIYLVKFDSKLRYQELMNQVEKYMRQKAFPTQMAKRVRDFYEYRYQRQYFLERFVLDCLSEQLRNEIFLDTCHKLIDKVNLFEDLPAGVVGSVLGCLKPVVYMRNDLIMKAGEIGESMYFIACGTVAVYSLKGAEVCHLEDGEHFGEVALLMRDRKRATTVVAIEITQVYRLDSHDFRDFIMTYHELYQRVEELASKRMHETALLDEKFKKRTEDMPSEEQ